MLTLYDGYRKFKLKLIYLRGPISKEMKCYSCKEKRPNQRFQNRNTPALFSCRDLLQNTVVGAIRRTRARRGVKSVKSTHFAAGTLKVCPLL